MSDEHEVAKETARRETELHGTDLPLLGRMELRDRLWDTSDTAERAALPAECALAGCGSTAALRAAITRTGGVRSAVHRPSV